jgi:probable rRNA maturation factor
MIEINNLTKFRVDKKAFSTVAKKVLSGENKKTKTLSLAFVGKNEIKKLNRKFRKKNKPTDVLSFELDNSITSKKDKYIGEIIICPEVVVENAKKYGVPVKSELMKVFVHGILHLCGYDHERLKKEEEIMEKKQEKYLNNKA